MLGVVGAVLAAAPASASSAVTSHTKKVSSSGQWYTQARNGTGTSSRAPHGSCKISPAAPRLNVSCPNGGSASLVYRFTAVAPVSGKPSAGVSHGGGKASVSARVKVSGSTITVTVSVGGHGSAWISLVSVGYYTR